MSKQTTSQTQKETESEPRPESKPESRFDPMPFLMMGPANMFDAWAHMAKDSMERMQSFYDELAEFEDSAYTQLKKNARDLGDMMSESITYMADLSREWRKLSIEATRRSTELFSPRA